MLTNVPFELQALNQWVVATGAVGPDGKRDKTPLNPRTGKVADVTDPSTWGSFAEAQNCGYPIAGFVLAKNDPYSIVDLDDPRVDKDGNLEVPEIVLQRTERHNKILEAFASYSELSLSGRGVHIICRGKVPHGCRRDRVELYSDSRYMICTGNVLKPLPIVDCQELLNGMFSKMAEERQTVELVQINSLIDDESIYRMASTAANADKFNKLWAGQWAGDYPSQSEADFALMSMLCFYSRDNDQCRRMFRWSGLARDKSVKDDRYLNFALSKIRAKEQPFIDFGPLFQKHEQLSLQLPVRDVDSGSATFIGGNAGNGNQENQSGNFTPDPIKPPPGNEGARIEGVSTRTGIETKEEKEMLLISNDTKDKVIGFPPGLIGELAEYFYSSAIRPVPEIALVTAIALVAGVAGRAYNISGSGLNQYLILLAKTGSGKEAIATSIDAMVKAVRPKIPMVDDFIGPSIFASGQGLVRHLEKKHCFVSILGEFGFTLQSLCDPKQNDAMRTLKKVLLDIYAKSGFGNSIKPTVYSDSDKNTKLVPSPNVTILGESNPDTFYEALDGAAIAQGLVPRFSVFEYDGPRPFRNPNAFAPPAGPLVDKFATVLTMALAADQQRAFLPVQIDAEAQNLLDSFDQWADAKMRLSQFDVVLQCWNRAHLKALKLSALVAIGVHATNPVVTKECAQWAIELTQRDIAKLLRRFISGDIGQGDEKMEADLRRAIADYDALPKQARKEYGVADRLIESPVIPLGYLRRRLRPLASFRNHRLGANQALTLVLKAMIESSELVQVPSLQAITQFGVNSPIYVKGPNW